MRKCLITHDKCNKHIRKLHVRPQWAPKRKPRGCQTAINTIGNVWPHMKNAINTCGNAWSHMKNAINTWGSCMSGHLGTHIGTPLKITKNNDWKCNILMRKSLELPQNVHKHMRKLHIGKPYFPLHLRKTSFSLQEITILGGPNEPVLAREREARLNLRWLSQARFK